MLFYLIFHNHKYHIYLASHEHARIATRAPMHDDSRASQNVKYNSRRVTMSRFYAGMFYHFHPTRTAHMLRTIYTIHKSFAYQNNTRNLTHVGMRMPNPTAELRRKASSSEGGVFLSVITNHGTHPDSTTSAVQCRRRIGSNFTAYYSRIRNLI